MRRSSADSAVTKRPARAQRPTEDGILASAERVFAERGYGQTPLRDLIAACGCSTTAFYARFDSKEAVLEALIRRLFDDLHGAALAKLPEARSMRAAYDLGLGVLKSKLRGRKGLWRIVLTEGAHAERTRPLVRDAYRTLAGLLAAQLALSGAHGHAVPDPEATGWAIVGALSMQLTRWAVFEELTEAQVGVAMRDVAQTLMPLRTLGRSEAKPVRA